MSPLLLLPTLLLGLPAFAGGQETYDRGVQATRQGDPTAVAAFSEALEQGAVDPSVYHGLGNGLYRQERLGPAIAAWQRGLQLDPTDADLRANLELARKRTQDRLDPPAAQTGPFFWQAVLSPAAQALAASLTAAAGLGLLLAHGLARRRRGSFPLSPRADALALLALSLVLAAGVAAQARRLPPAVVLVPEVVVKSGLGAEGVELFALHEGAVVRAVERYQPAEGQGGAAVLIELPDARKGWVPATAVDLADPSAPFPGLPSP